MDFEKEGLKLGAEVYKRLARDYKSLSYDDIKLLIDHIYGGIYQKIFEQTYYKKRGTEYWYGNK